MKRSEDFEFQEPRYQSRAAILIMAYEYIRNFIGQFWFLFLILLFNADFWKYIIGLVALLVLAGSGVFSILAFRRFTFYIRDGSFIVNKGIFRKSRKNVSLGRIQAVHTEQNILHRILGVLELKVDTAGTGEKEFSIPALEPRLADRLRTKLLRERAMQSTPGEQEAHHRDEDRTEDKIFALRLIDLVKIGLSQNHFRTFGLIMAFLIGTSNRVEEFFNTSVYDYLTRSSFWKSVMSTSLSFYLFLFIGAVLLTLVVSIVLALFRYYGLTTWKSARGIRIESGLLNRRVQAAPIRKVQIYSWIVNPLRKLFGLFTIVISQASSEESSRSQALSIAGARASHIEMIKDLIYGRIASDWPEQVDVDFSMAWRYALFFGLLTALITFLLYYFLSWTLWLMVIAVPAVVLLNFWYYYNWDIRFNADCVTVSRGVFNVRTSVLEWYKLQSVEISQTPYMSRNGLANLSLYTASGEISLPYLNVDDAGRLYHYALYRTEEGNRSWM